MLSNVSFNGYRGFLVGLSSVLMIMVVGSAAPVNYDVTSQVNRLYMENGMGIVGAGTEPCVVPSRGLKVNTKVSIDRVDPSNTTLVGTSLTLHGAAFQELTIVAKNLTYNRAVDHRWSIVQQPADHTLSVKTPEPTSSKTGSTLATFTPRVAGNYLVKLEACTGSNEFRSAQVFITVTSASQNPLSAFPFHYLPIEIINLGSQKCLDVSDGATANGSNVAQFRCHGGKNQSWFLIHLGDSNYQIRAGHVGSKNLDIEGGSSDDGAKVQIYDAASDAQIFHFQRASDRNYQIVSKSGKCLDVADGSNADGAKVQQYTCHGASNQRWIIRAQDIKPFNLIAKHSNKCMDVADESKSNNANVQQFSCARRENQRWYIQYAESTSNGTQYYTLVSNNSRKCLDVENASMDNNANVQQYECTEGDNQKWAIEGNSDGYVTIRNKRSGKCIDVFNASTADQANIQQYTCNDGNNQRWWWANYVQRHVQIVQVARSNGRDRATASDEAFVRQHIDRANDVYRRYGTELVYDPTLDKSNVDSDTLYKLNSDDPTIFTCLDGGTGTSKECASKYATNWPDKVVIFIRPGNGFSWGDLNYIVLGNLDKDRRENSVVCTNVPNTQWLAHEIGHYMGLQHTFVEEFGSRQDASKYLRDKNYDPNAFDGDKLRDTPPDPYLRVACLAPHSPTAKVTLDGNSGPVDFTVDTNNIMSRYYNASIVISPSQAAVTRATSYARVF